jgi:hypothetical protein
MMAEQRTARPVSGEIMTGTSVASESRPVATDIVDADYEVLPRLVPKAEAVSSLARRMVTPSIEGMDILRKPERIVITATKSGTEKNATIFAKFWAEALSDPAADTDKNETISALEAFKYAEQKTAGYYETNKRLATLAMDTEVCFRSPAERAAFSEELTTAVAKLVAKYHDDSDPGARAHRLVVMAHPTEKSSGPREVS